MSVNLDEIDEARRVLERIVQRAPWWRITPEIEQALASVLESAREIRSAAPVLPIGKRRKRK